MQVVNGNRAKEFIALGAFGSRILQHHFPAICSRQSVLRLYIVYLIPFSQFRPFVAARCEYATWILARENAHSLSAVYHGHHSTVLLYLLHRVHSIATLRYR